VWLLPGAEERARAIVGLVVEGPVPAPRARPGKFPRHLQIVAAAQTKAFNSNQHSKHAMLLGHHLPKHVLVRRDAVLARRGSGALESGDPFVAADLPSCIFSDLRNCKGMSACSSGSAPNPCWSYV
jgi:hypothetical protein